MVAIRVHVADSTGAPVAGADVSIVRELTAVLARGTTNDRGDQTLTIPRSGAEKNLIVRKIGFVRADRFFADSTEQTLNVRLARVVQSLEAVRVTAEENLRHKSYFIDAEAIENSPRPVVDALDIVTKLRPDMIWGRQGEPDRIGLHGNASGYRAGPPSPIMTARQGAKYGYCPPVQNVWVNGERQRLIAFNPMAYRRLTGDAVLFGAAPRDRARVDQAGTRAGDRVPSLHGRHRRRADEFDERDLRHAENGDRLRGRRRIVPRDGPSAVDRPNAERGARAASDRRLR